MTSVLHSAPICFNGLMQMWYSPGRHQFPATLLRDLSLFLMGNGLQFTDILWFAPSSLNPNLRIWDFLWSSSQMPRQPLWNLPGHLLKVCPDGRWGILRIIVLLKGPMTTRLQFPHRRHDDFSYNFLILKLISLALRCMLCSSSSRYMAYPSVWKVPVLFVFHKTKWCGSEISAYWNQLFFCFLYILEFGDETLLCFVCISLCKLKPQHLPSLRHATKSHLSIFDFLPSSSHCSFNFKIAVNVSKRIS